MSALGIAVARDFRKEDYRVVAVIGDGAIPIKRICEWILKAGYQGPFDLELLGPRIDKEGRIAAVARSARNLGDILDSLGAT